MMSYGKRISHQQRDCIDIVLIPDFHKRSQGPSHMVGIIYLTGANSRHLETCLIKDLLDQRSA